MGKLPWFKFNPSWWLTDPELSKCDPATRGVWIDLVCAMHQSDRSGELSGTTEQIARLGRCSTVELTHALTELQANGAADVTFRNNNVTVVNRRMKREFKSKKATALRVKRHRSNAKGNGDETVERIEDRGKNKDLNTIHWESVKQSFLTVGDWAFNFCREKSVTETEFKSVAKSFISNIELAEDYKTLRELKRHFLNWYNKNKGQGNKGFQNPGFSSGPPMKKVQ